MLKEYTVNDGDAELYSELVFAQNSNRAKMLAWKRPAFEGFEEYIKLRVKRYPKADGKDNGFEGCCSDWKILRLLEWQCEDGYSCATCGLNDFDHDEFRACSECHQCPDCGHTDDCDCEGDK